MNARPDKERSCLLVVDAQPDFMPGGALAVPEGDKILAPLQRLMESGLFGFQAATQDWHPPDHMSFASAHPGWQPFETVELYGCRQTLWPDHCVAGTAGAALHPALPWARVDAIVRKGTDRMRDSYSGFQSNVGPDGKRIPTGLGGLLKERQVREIWVAGLARDYCVKWTAEDAAREGFQVRFLWDCTRPVAAGSDEQARRDLEAAGVEIVLSGNLTIA